MSKSKPLEAIADDVTERLFASVEGGCVFKHIFADIVLAGLKEAVQPLQVDLIAMAMKLAAKPEPDVIDPRFVSHGLSAPPKFVGGGGGSLGGQRRVVPGYP